MDCEAKDGKKVPHGEIYLPGPDYCTECRCNNGTRNSCHSVLCQSPQDCRYFRQGNSCCEFICVHDILPPIPDNKRERDSTSDLGLRMVGSTVTAILSLALLLFLIHRLRQRKRRGVQREYFEENTENISGLHSDSCHSNPCCHTAVCMNGNEQDDLYFDFHTHNFQWKPPYYFPHREPPPSYNEATRNDSQTPSVSISNSIFSSFPSMRSARMQSPSTTEINFGGRSLCASAAAIIPELTQTLHQSDNSSIENSSHLGMQGASTLLSDQIYEDHGCASRVVMCDSYSTINGNSSASSVGEITAPNVSTSGASNL